MKKTKKDLLVEMEAVRNENQRHQQEKKLLVERDEEKRREFTNLLGNTYHGTQAADRCLSEYSNFGESRRSRAVLTWPEIFFAIGELYSDANLQCIAEQMRNLEQENHVLKDQLNQRDRK